jgi:deoxycytidylate deaminase
MLSEAYIKYYMNICQCVAEKKISCYSRAVGCVIVNPVTNSIINTGKNGPPSGEPHCDSFDYLSNVFLPQLTKQEFDTIETKFGTYTQFLKTCVGLKQCPRRYINAGPGEKVDLCSCVHAESNGIARATESLVGATMFLWSEVNCCNDCSAMVVQSGIKYLYMLETQGPDYGFITPWRFKHAGIIVEKHSKEWYLEG